MNTKEVISKPEVLTNRNLVLGRIERAIEFQVFGSPNNQPKSIMNVNRAGCRAGLLSFSE